MQMESTQATGLLSFFHCPLDRPIKPLPPVLKPITTQSTPNQRVNQDNSWDEECASAHAIAISPLPESFPSSSSSSSSKPTFEIDKSAPLPSFKVGSTKADEGKQVASKQTASKVGSVCQEKAQKGKGKEKEPEKPNLDDQIQLPLHTVPRCLLSCSTLQLLPVQSFLNLLRAQALS